MDIYTLKALAVKEGVSYDFLRKLMTKVSRGQVEIWKGYKFIGPGKGYWLACLADQKINFHDAP